MDQIRFLAAASPDIKVRDPVTGVPLPPLGTDPVDIGDGEMQYGARVLDDLYWRRRIADGDAIEVDPKTGQPIGEAPAKSPAKPAKAKE